jgi:protein TonB
LAPSTVPADLAPDDGLGSDDAAPLSPAGALGGLVGIPGGSLGERSSDGGGGGNPAAETRPRRVGGVIQAPTKVHHAAPEYPAIARRARVQGTVIIQCTISAEGRVVDVETLRGVPLLNRAATDAVRQWRFTPTRLDGKAIAVSMTVSVVFRLD